MFLIAKPNKIHPFSKRQTKLAKKRKKEKKEKRKPSSSLCSRLIIKLLRVSSQVACSGSNIDMSW